jgi:DSBA-like thioredoxin domain-containing protein
MHVWKGEKSLVGRHYVSVRLLSGAKFAPQQGGSLRGWQRRLGAAPVRAQGAQVWPSRSPPGGANEVFVQALLSFVSIEPVDFELVSEATFHEWFIARRAPGVDGHIERVLASLDKSPAPTLARAKGAEGERLLKAATDAARKLGIFGAPTFAIGAKIFWGDDRLEEALAFAAGR